MEGDAEAHILAREWVAHVTGNAEAGVTEFAFEIHAHRAALDRCAGGPGCEIEGEVLDRSADARIGIPRTRAYADWIQRKEPALLQQSECHFHRSEFLDLHAGHIRYLLCRFAFQNHIQAHILDLKGLAHNTLNGEAGVVQHALQVDVDGLITQNGAGCA